MPTPANHLKFAKLSHLALVAGLLLSLTLPLSAAQFVEADVCVYGATSGGIVAAVQAARLGASVVLLEPGRHLGGMTSGGLGATDTGKASSIGGMAREFYLRVGQAYGQTNVAFRFEPHVAERTFSNMLAEFNVPVYFQSRLQSVTKDGLRIREIQTEDGSLFRARMFIDTTYEGDLMAQAGVSYTVGRESTNTYGESLNGVRYYTIGGGYAGLNIDPYVVPGDTNSGPIHLLSATGGGTPGSADDSVQAYNFRLCLTQVETNKIPLAPPPNYDPLKHEFLARYLQARVALGQTLYLTNILKIDTLPNGKTDINNGSSGSTDYTGMSKTYPTNTYAGRQEIWNAHEVYNRGLLWFLATDPRVPANVRAEMNTYGLCRDEFLDTGGWPHQLYVREARRMISDYVMLQQDCQSQRTAPDGIGLASYAIDSHSQQLFITNSKPTMEGGLGVALSNAYPVSYRAIIPRASECENLFVPWSLSASHVAFCSIRMEPVLMILSQSAATAAVLAMRDNLPVQQVSYDQLRLQLLADAQLISTLPEPGITIVDNNDPGVIRAGAWTSSASVTGYYGIDYLHDGNTNKGLLSVTFVPDLPTNGQYEILARWVDNPNRATNAPMDIIHAAGTNHLTINQRTNGQKWVSFGAYYFNAGTNGRVMLGNAGTTGYVIADAVWFRPFNFTNLPTVNVLASDAHASEYLTNTARFTVTRSGDSTVPLNVAYRLGGTASNGVDYLALPSVVTLASNQNSASIVVTPLAHAAAQGTRTVTLTLLSDPTYALGPYAQANAVIEDIPFEQWRANNFTPAELLAPAISGKDADPDHDGLPNMVEYAFGLDPKKPDRVGLPKVEIRNGQCVYSYQQPRSASDLLWTLRTATNLTGAWTNALPLFNSVSALDTGTNLLTTLTESNSPTTPRRRFFRLEIRQGPEAP